MKLKDDRLILYTVDDSYLQYLCRFDNNVRLKLDRKYTGILISDNGTDYCVPLTCKVKNRNPKLTINIKHNKETIAQLTINNMVPVTNELIHIVDIKNSKDKDYLNNEIAFLRKQQVLDSVISKAENAIYVIHNPNNFDHDFFKKLCANYAFLENKCLEYTRVQSIMHKLKRITSKEDLYYIYDNLNNTDSFENVALRIDGMSDIINIQSLSRQEINEEEAK